jgi:hypothetical protein
VNYGRAAKEAEAVVAQLREAGDLANAGISRPAIIEKEHGCGV